MKSYPVKENSIGSAVSEILRYKQTDRHRSTLYYRLKIRLKRVDQLFKRYTKKVKSSKWLTPNLTETKIEA